MKKILLSLMAVFALSASAQDYTTLTTLDFEDDSKVFEENSRITVSVSDDATLGSKVQTFKCASNAQNGYSFSRYSFKDALYAAVDVVESVKVELDYYNTNGGRAILSIGDADVRSTTGNSSKTTYSNKGAIFALGSNKTNSLLNGVSGALADYTNKWMHVVVTVDQTNKTYSYSITDKASGSEIKAESDKAFYSADADKCTQVDIFGYINSSTCAHLDNVVISYIGSKAAKANYTIKYMCGTTEVKESETVEGVVGNAPQLLAAQKADFTAEGKKYIYTDDNAATSLVAADGSTVVTVNYREAATYTVNAKYNGEIISTATVFEGDAAAVYAPYYQLVDGTLYGTPKADKGTLSYGQITVNNVAADTDVNVTYTEDATQNAAFFSEAENIPTLKAFVDQYTQIRMSNGAVGYAEADGAVIVNLPAGKYTLESSSRAGTTKFFAGETQIHEVASTGAVTTTTSAEFTLTEATDITVGAGAVNAYFDYVLIRKTGEYVAPAIELPISNLQINDWSVYGGNIQVMGRDAEGNYVSVEFTTDGSIDYEYCSYADPEYSWYYGATAATGTYTETEEAQSIDATVTFENGKTYHITGSYVKPVWTLGDPVITLTDKTVKVVFDVTSVAKEGATTSIQPSINLTLGDDTFSGGCGEVEAVNGTVTIELPLEQFYLGWTTQTPEFKAGDVVTVSFKQLSVYNNFTDAPYETIWDAPLAKTYDVTVTAATAIKNINAAANNNVKFNIAGQRVNNAKGIVIMNGKKVRF